MDGEESLRPAETCANSLEFAPGVTAMLFGPISSIGNAKTNVLKYDHRDIDMAPMTMVIL